ncbi:MAG TPA: alpha-amylase family glycosyl hydrolase, partial [Mobilitalea sp.]|nr:alpha-amylase family glycosyl hydrolase [Mobilitalea sp.]
GFDMDFLLHFNTDCYNALFRCEEAFFSKKGKGDIGIFAAEYKDLYASTQGKGLVCIPSGNHDMVRLSKGRDMEELKVCFAFLLSMPGAPFIYYGDEIGMRYVEGLTSVEGGFGRTGSRTPMQWDEGVNCGFSTASPDRLYIQLDEDNDHPTVDKQLKEEASLLNEVKKLIAIRQNYPALQSCGEFEFIYAKEYQYPLVYLRKSGGQEIIVAINPSGREESCVIDRTVSETIYTVGGTSAVRDGILQMPPCSAAFFAG